MGLSTANLSLPRAHLMDLAPEEEPKVELVRAASLPLILFTHRKRKELLVDGRASVNETAPAWLSKVESVANIAISDSRRIAPIE